MVHELDDSGLLVANWPGKWTGVHVGLELVGVTYAESGKLNTWGSTTELGQCYLISGKQQVSKWCMHCTN